VLGWGHKIRRLFGDENGEGRVDCHLDLLGMAPGVQAGAQILLLGGLHKTGTPRQQAERDQKTTQR